MKLSVKAGLFCILMAWAGQGWSYPLDGYPYTGILRLEGFRLAHKSQVQGIKIHAGAGLDSDQVDLRLGERPDFELPQIDADFTVAVEKFLGDEADHYAVAVLNLSDPGNPKYAEHNGRQQSNVGSVGKLLVALGVFQALADIYPDDIDGRLKILRSATVTADHFIQTDHHIVPFWNVGAKKISYRPLQIGDRASLWTYLDWMLSASSNAAASMVIKELMLLVHFKDQYPPGDGQSQHFFSRTSKKELTALLFRALQEPITRNGLDLEHLRQGSLFTWKGKQLVPGTTSYASPRELMRFMVKLEQGKLVDAFSSREIKRLIYMTQGRIRYASSPALNNAAVYYKSGSLYKCQAEPNFKCGKYQGNVVNRLASLAIVESPAAKRQLYYMVVVMSNVLRKNSAVAHQTLATRIHRLIESGK
ncbi:MAG: serine hydrolase [Desulfobacteraceae bacterium]|jgi:hypothetical protein|nr:serine hydrolase [Desulfobacteraceae bacterium]